MKISMEWLRDYCRFDGTPTQLGDLLRRLGVGLEGIEEVGGDVRLSLEVTSNRNDLNGILGVAREVAAATGVPLTIPPVDLRGGGVPVRQLADVSVDDPTLCPRYTARVITGVTVGPSPAWMQRRLETIGLRPVNNVVDITNYVLFEACQPLHAFDYDKLDGGRIAVRTARAGERITAIDGTRCDLSPQTLVIADASKPVAVAGVMGGLETEVSESTSRVLLESAQFSRVRVRRASRLLGLASESSLRFEHGVDPVGVDWASRRAASLMEELARGTACEGVLDFWPEPWTPRRVQIRVPEVGRILGRAVPAPRVRSILSSLQLDVVDASAENVTVNVPSFRPDLEKEIDLIEEVARHEGLDSVPSATTLRMRTPPIRPEDQLEAAVHEILTGCGFDEVVTVSFLDEELARSVSPWSSGPVVLLSNSMRKDENGLRRSLLPHLVQVKKTNEDHGHADIRVYEVAHVYLRDRAGEPAQEKRVLGLLHRGEFGETKAVLELMEKGLQFRQPTRFDGLDVPFLEAGSGAVWKAGDRVLAYLGTVCRRLVERFDLRDVPSVAEVDLDAVQDLARFDRTFQSLPKFPSTDRDLAIVVDEPVTWERIVQCVDSMKIPILRSVEFFDLFRGKGIPAGKKSVAFRLVFQSPERTLTNEEVNGIRDDMVRRLSEGLGAQLR